MTDEKQKRPVGRPRKYPSEGKRPTLTFRCRGSLYENLRQDAERNFRSISEEVEHRLMASYETETVEVVLRRVLREERGDVVADRPSATVIRFG